MMMNRNLEIFIKVAELESITKAAKLMYITQPAVSNAIKKLEDELNVSLFFRDKRSGLTLTPVGKQILALAQEMANVDNRITQAALASNQIIGGRISVGSMPFLTSTLLTKALGVFRLRYPSVEIDLREANPNELLELVGHHQVDFALTAAPFGPYQSRQVMTDYIVAAFPPGQKAPKHFDLATNDSPLLLNQAALETILDNADRSRAAISDRIVVQNVESEIEMVAAGLGIGIMSALPLASLGQGLQSCPVKPDISFDVGMIATDFDQLSPAAKALCDILEEVTA